MKRVTESTRILGYTFLHPGVVPRPHVQSVTQTQDEFFILGSKGCGTACLWRRPWAPCAAVPDALAAAKLCTLAQSRLPRV